LGARILVADNLPAFRHFVREVIRKHGGYRVVAEAEDGLTAVQKAEEVNPDIILLDISMPQLNGIQAARRICQMAPSAKILFLTQNLSLELLLEAMRLGASGYLIKSQAARELVPALEAIRNGNTYVSDYFRWRDE